MDLKKLVALLTMLCSIVQHQVTSRNIVALKEDIYWQLLEICMLCVEDPSVRYWASNTLVHLLFNEISRDTGGDNTSFCLPEKILKRYDILYLCDFNVYC